MSKQVEERVVSMKFDNAQFESGVKTSLSTLDKLKNSLNLKSASKGLENINTAANKVNMSGLSKGVETMQAKFSALDVIGVTALANIANSAVNTGKRMVKALTLEPVTTGFREYELKMNSIQTIMSNTANKGTTMNDVTKVLDELNTYADKTIYNFAEMTRNIGTFTAAGVGLKESASAIQGIANLAAASGSSSQQASTAMYQLSQALAAGTVKLQDWNSVVNAGMGGQKFQEALKATAREHGVAVDKIIKKQGSFRESLQEGWISADILNETLSKFTVDGAKKYADSMMKSGKWTQKQADALIKEAQAMEDAATKVKTFTQLWDTLKEAAQSGWAQTWELIVGDFDEAKAFFTELSDLFGGIIDTSSKARNSLLKDTLSSKWDSLTEKINKAGISTKDFTAKLKEVAKVNGIPIDKLIKKYGSLSKVIKAGKIPTDIFIKTLKKFAGEETKAADATGKVTKKVVNLEKVVKRVIKGDFGNGADRVKALTKAGYDYATVQDLVNKVLKGEKVNFDKLSTSQIQNLGYTKEQAKAIKELAAEAEKTGTPINELIANLEKPSGRELLLGSLMNSLKGLGNILSTIKKAWKDTFKPLQSDQLYGMIEGLNTLTKKFKEFAGNKETVDKLFRSFKGLFAIIDIITSFTGGVFKIAIKTLAKLLGMVDVDVLDVTASIGDAIVKFRDWLFNNNLITKSLEAVVSGIKTAVIYIKDLFDAFINLPIIQKTIQKFQDAFTNMPEIGKNMAEGLKQGLEDGTMTVIDVVVELGKKMLEAIKNVLGIHSPSTEAAEIGDNFILGFVNAITSGIQVVIGALKQLGSKCLEVLKGIDFGAVLATAFGIGVFVTLKKISDVLDIFAAPLKGLGNVLDGAGKSLTGFGKVLNSFALQVKSKALLDIAKAILMIVGAVVVMTFIDPAKLWSCIGALAVLAGIIGALAVVVSKAISKIDAKNALKIVGVSGALLLVANAILIMSAAILILSRIDWKQGLVALGGLIAIVGSLVGLIWACGEFVKGDGAKTISKMGSTLIKLSLAMLIMAVVVKMVAGLDPNGLSQGIACIGAFSTFIAGLIAVCLLAGRNINKVGGTILKISAAILLLVFVIKSVSKLEPESLTKGIDCIKSLMLMIVGLLAASRLAGPMAGEIGGSILKISVAILLLIAAIKLISKLKPGEIVKGIIAIGFFELLILGLVTITQKATKDSPKIAGTLLAMVAAIGILAAIAVALSFIKIANLAKGIIAMGFLAAIMSMMIESTKDAKEVKGTVMAMAVAIGVMAASLAVLSFIKPEKLIASVAALGTVMILFGKVLEMVKGFTAGLGSLIVMTVAIGIIGGMLFLLGQLPVENALGSAVALSAVLLAMAASMTIIGAIGPMATSGLVAVGIMTLVMGALTLMIHYLGDLEVESVLGIAASLSTLILSLSAACILLGVAGTFGPAAYIGIGALMTLIVGIGTLITAIGALVTKFPCLETFLNTGIPILQKIGYALGSFFGNIIGGFGAGISSGLPEIGANLSAFMSEMEKIKPAALEGLKNLASGMLILTGTSLLESITSFITGQSSFSTFANALPTIGKGLKDFSDSLDGIDPVNVAIAAQAAKHLAEMASSMPKEGGLLGKIIGESDVSAFGEDLPKLGTGISKFSESVKDINPKNVEAACKSLKSIAETASSIPNSGGLLGKIIGDNDAGAFGEDLPKLGTGISKFSESVKDINPKNVESASSAIKTLAQMATEIPNSGGLLASIVGDNDIGSFGEKLPTLGTGLKKFSDSVADINTQNVSAGANAAKTLAEMADAIPKEGGFSALFGKDSITSFSGKLPTLGDGLKGFSDSLDGINPQNITAAASAGKSLADMANTAPKDSSHLETFGNNISKFGSKLNKFFTDLSGISGDTMKTANSAIKSLSTTISKLDSSKLQTMSSGIDGVVKSMRNLSKISENTADGFSKAFSKLAKTAANDPLEKFKEAEPKMQKAGESLIKKFTDGLKKQESSVKKASAKLASSGVSAAKEKRSSFYSAGSYLVDGFASGISVNTWKAEAKARAMARAAENAAENELDINSPSKKFYKIGVFAGQGFVNALGDYASKSYKASSKMADDAKKGLSKAISKISNVVNSDIDAQPTIRPVLDLSDISNGARAINGMLSLNPSVGLLSNVGAINTMMNRNQNGVNDDVVSAINDLGKAISNMSGDTYSINGVTYDDGSNISNAVKSLVRAAKIERRI